LKFTRHATCRLDLEREDRAVVALRDQVDLVTVMRAPVAGARESVEPGSVLEQLAHDEGLQQVTELGEGGRVFAGELVRREAEQPGCDAGVEDVQLGGCGCSRPQRLPAGG
jgi:hypothetical protein